MTRFAPTALAWGVHLFTASGAVLALFGLLAIARGDLRAAALLSLAALFVDGVDGALARWARVSERLPGFDGRRLDDIVDYVNYVLVPAAFMIEARSLAFPAFAALPLLASAIGFCRSDAKTADHFFLGFPSYWNLLAIYLWWYAVPAAVGTLIVAVLAALVLTPLRFIYPTRMKRLRTISCVLGALGLAVMVSALLTTRSTHAHTLMTVSIGYPIYYLVVSAWLGGWFERFGGANA